MGDMQSRRKEDTKAYSAMASARRVRLAMREALGIVDCLADIVEKQAERIKLLEEIIAERGLPKCL